MQLTRVVKIDLKWTDWNYKTAVEKVHHYVDMFF